MITLQNISTSAYGARSFQPAAMGNGTKETPPQPLAAGEKVELSDVSITINRLRDKIDALPEIRIKLVEEIKQRIRENNYPFVNNLNKVADNWREYAII